MTTSNYYGYYNKVIFAYACNLQMSGVSNGGIYYQTTGSAPNRVLTVEWRASSVYGSGTGNFQIKLFEATGNIEWFYGPSTINEGSLTQYNLWVAWIGIKNYGEPYEYITSSPGPDTRGPASNRAMWFTNPQLAPDTVAVTGIRYYTYGPPYYYAEYEQIVPGSSPAMYHSTFPTVGGEQIGFKASPVLDDVASDSLWFSPTRPADAYGVNATVQVSTRFQNIGAQRRQNVPVRPTSISTVVWSTRSRERSSRLPGRSFTR